MDEMNRRVTVPTIAPRPKPEDYKHIRAWGIMMGSSSGYIEMEQQMAAQLEAPIDAIYQESGWNEGRWHRFSEVTSEDTIVRISEILERL